VFDVSPETSAVLAPISNVVSSMRLQAISDVGAFTAGFSNEEC
jgi:hypothetical protein